MQFRKFIFILEWKTRKIGFYSNGKMENRYFHSILKNMKTRFQHHRKSWNLGFTNIRKNENSILLTPRNLKTRFYQPRKVYFCRIPSPSVSSSLPSVNRNLSKSHKKHGLVIRRWGGSAHPPPPSPPKWYERLHRGQSEETPPKSKRKKRIPPW